MKYSNLYQSMVSSSWCFLAPQLAVDASPLHLLMRCRVKNGLPTILSTSGGRVVPFGSHGVS
jgi:hypothetical protein